MKKLMCLIGFAGSLVMQGCIHTKVDYIIDDQKKVSFDRFAFLNATKIPTLKVDPTTGIIEVLDYESDGGAAGIDRLANLTEKIAEGVATGVVKGATK